MRAVSAQAYIPAPREDVFDFLSDMAARVAYADHYLKDFRLARQKTQGKGAAARFWLPLPFAGAWTEMAISDTERPHRIVEEGRMGVLGRNKLWTVYELTDDSGRTRVELRSWVETENRLDAFRQGLGGRRWLRRQLARALKRLRAIFEDRQATELPRASIAGYEPLTAPRFGGSPARVAGPGTGDGPARGVGGAADKPVTEAEDVREGSPGEGAVPGDPPAQRD
jgi:uncharacterized protein YndB with AHSA1/START domain